MCGRQLLQLWQYSVSISPKGGFFCAAIGGGVLGDKSMQYRIIVSPQPVLRVKWAITT
jgi:hypothetical protein